ncbi:hypothetical protein [Fredinandcohnia sp. 179-A 10B2 NHS]|uniref:hypothetical protein n=1 Tax=Fredinandcohnia sp. 179-A 10B2 NHS TaxID=3235176 RepID=UPI0039A0E96D
MLYILIGIIISILLAFGTITLIPALLQPEYQIFVLLAMFWFMVLMYIDMQKKKKEEK